jgi:hypothetical protein
MLIFDNNSQTIILDHIDVPVLSDYFWVLDLNIMDFTLSPLLMFEEITCPSIEIEIFGFRLILPAMWNLLVYDDYTQQLDIVGVKELPGREFTAFVYGEKKTSPIPGKITTTDYILNYKNIGPSLTRQQMLCHPISPTEWINISPTDTYNKYLKNKTISDII